MIVFTVRRLLQAIPILLGAALIVYWLMAIPPDPVLKEFAGHNPPIPPATILANRDRMHLLDGFWYGFGRWVARFVQGDFGPTLSGAENIRHDLVQHLGVTTHLVVPALFLAVTLAVITGVMSAIKQYSFRDYTFTFFGFLFLAMPAFWIAQLLKDTAVNFNLATGTRFFGTLGDRSIPQPAGFGPQMVDYLGHIVLPTISLSLITYAALSRFQRASMLEVINSDYVRLARAKGITPRRLLTRHMLRTALVPMTTATALTVAAFFGGTVITETIFNWQGLGTYTVGAIVLGDRYIVLAVLMLTGFFVILGNLIADILYAVLDPRIRYE
jgi:peptide/nickel transport system permease protein